MDSTGGDLGHAAQEVDLNIEKQSASGLTNDRSSALDEVVEEKQELDQHSSGSSSEDVTAIEKLDSQIVKVGDVKDGEEAYAHLPPHERDVVKRQLDIPPVTVTYRTLYRYATRNDLLIVFVSAICAIIGGAVMPLMTVSVPLRVFIQSILTDSITGHLRPAGGNFSKLLQRKPTGVTTYFINLSPDFILRILSDRRIRHHLYLYGWLHLYRGTYYPENPRAVSGGHYASEYRLF